MLFGAVGIPKELTVEANPAEGIRWTFIAATNLQPYACWNMAKALKRGLGTSTNLIEAYAWLRVFADTPPGSVVGRVEANELVLKLDIDSLQEARTLAAQFKARNWRQPVVRVIPEDDPRLKVQGIIFGTKYQSAVINGKSVGEGEYVQIPLNPRTLLVKCLKIKKNSVLVTVDGEDVPRLLKLK